MPYDIGDSIHCKIVGNSVVGRTAEHFDIILSFEVVGFDKETSSNIVYIPEYYSIKNKIKIQETQTEEYDLPKSFIHKTILLVRDDQVCGVKKAGMDGMFCCQCGMFYPWAVANQENGTLKCFQCRQDPWR